ncbi:MAG: hypothetical protein K0Q93_2142 [Nocardioidaceae bacterium]|jgi:hypothetical protein|nr:hypothetical protein [Nocardioidaceae bacterium]
MSGTNLVAIKRAVFERLAAAQQLADMGAEVAYAFNPRSQPRIYVYLGAGTFEQEYITLRGGGNRVPREEVAFISAYVEVWEPGSNMLDLDQQAVEMGTVLEEILAADANLDDLPGVVYGGVSGGDLVQEHTDSGAGVTLEYRLRFVSRLN